MAEDKKDIANSSSKPFSEILQEFKKSQKQALEFQLMGVIESTDMQAALELPLELTFTEINGHVAIMPVYDWSRVNDPLDLESSNEEQMRNSKLFGHTHNKIPSGFIVNTLSVQDLFILGSVNNKSKIMLVTELGISKFSKPTLDLHGEKINSLTPEQYSQLLVKYGKEKGIMNLYSVSSLPKTAKDRTGLAQEFVKRTGMLQVFAPWSDNDRIGLLLNELSLK